MGRMALLAAVLCGLACTSVKMVQRDGCWMKRTETTLGGSHEELGFCSRQQPQWAEDRLARLVQECMAQADYRWENRAIAAWNRSEPIPPQESDAEITKLCMAQATQALGLEAENGHLKARLAELDKDRAALRGETEKDRDFLQQNSDKMVTALGEAAKKPAPNATATATSATRSESDQRSESQPPQAPAVTVVGVPAPQAPAVTVVGMPALRATAQPQAAPSPANACLKSPARKLAAPGCEKAPEPQPATASAAPPKAG